MAKADQLAQLKDIHLPDPIGWWPLAPGWYFLIAGAALIVLALAIFLYRLYQQGRAKRQALRMLAEYIRLYQEDQNHQLMSARLSELLRRVALAYYPRQQVASLEGQAWLDFLNEAGNGVNFNAVRELLIVQPYQAKGDYPLKPLISRCEQWIKQRGKPCCN